MEVVASHAGGVAFHVTARGHRVLCDQPVEGGGGDAGISPPEFLLASLAACAGYYAAEYLKTRNLPVDGLEVRVHADKAFHPARLHKFEIVVAAPGAEADDRHREGVLRAVRRCLIHNTLLNPPEIEVHAAGAPAGTGAGA